MKTTQKMLLTRRFKDDEPPTDCKVEAEIDMERILESFGRRALLNKSKTAKALHGMVVVKVRVIRAGEQ